ncbi:hypothetical protein HPP92_020254 [Vanilla planifolia]|uniref:Pentatricopeptide repeat-containing protein n=1 Tax=Vanilla planifolia TaxID=51239 RepID=A0A835Q3B8_VANPL|nr:hypothetical protein HPP92_020662 [Vanilla planifolia]KAG0461778.1 hypothetical protein HPP92_020254 [Vanilla planifolia]
MLIFKTTRRISSTIANSLGFVCRANTPDGEVSSSTSSWILAIRSSTVHRRFRHALSLYVQMLRDGGQPDPFAISAALKACAHLRCMGAAAAIHAQVHKLGHRSDVYANTALVDVYSKLDGIGSTRKVFDEMTKRNTVTWNSMLSAYLRDLNTTAARSVFERMPKRDAVSWNSMVSGYAKAGDLDRAAEIFSVMPERTPASWNGMICAYAEVGDMGKARKLFDEMPLRSNVSWIAMISGYSNSGDVAAAEELFKGLENKDVFSWNAMIACYVQNGFPKEGIRFFIRMQKPDAGVKPDEMTFSSVISACSRLGDLKLGLLTESYMTSIGVEMDDHLRTALIDLYSKCGAMEQAFKLYNSIRKKDLVACSAMILGCGLNGRTKEAVCLFKEMVDLQIAPNSATFIGLLTAYNHAGLVDEGRRCFTSMWSRYLVHPTRDHYAIMVDLLGRKGRLEEARLLIEEMPMEPHVGVWGALLLACRLHGNVGLGEHAAKRCFELEPDSSGYYVILANIYAEAGEWEKAKRLRRAMEEMELAKVPGCSWVEPR